MRIFIILFLISAMCSCHVSQAEYVVPENIITEDEFTLLLSDIYLAESVSGLNIKNVQGQQFDTTYAFNPFKDHGVTKIKFDSSLAFYSKHPTKFKEILNKAIEKISQKQMIHDMETHNK